MRYFFIICAALLLLGVVNLPIGYYTFLRIVVTIGAVLAVIFTVESFRIKNLIDAKK